MTRNLGARRPLAIVVIAGLLLSPTLLAHPVRAAAPEPRNPIDLDRFMGRWYEILRTPNANQRNCYAAQQVWSRSPSGSFSIVQTCHRGSPTGEPRTVMTTARVLDPPANTKWEATFRLIGLPLRGRYWVIDRADDYSWMIATTEDGRYPAILARKPSLPADQLARLRERTKSLGLPTSQLVETNSGR